MGSGLGALFFQGVGGDYGDSLVSGVVPFTVGYVALDADAHGVPGLDVARIKDAAEGRSLSSRGRGRSRDWRGKAGRING